MIKALTAIALFLFVWPVRVAANNCTGNIGGMFANGAYFCGTYDKSFVVVTGGQKVEREKFDLNVNYKGVIKNLTYVYDSDGPSQIKSNPLGFISITTHTGSMDGDIISAYVFFDGEKLASLGAVDVSLDKNIISGSSYIDYNNDATEGQKVVFLKSILEGNEDLILNKDDIFENASLFLMPYARNLKGSDNFYKLRKIPSVLKDAGYDGYYELFQKKVM